MPRVLLVTFTVPRPDAPLLGRWNVDQCAALNALGCEARIACLTPIGSRLPRVDVIDGVRVERPRVPFAWTPKARFEHCVKHPRATFAVARLATTRAVWRAARDLRPDALVAQHVVPHGPAVARVARALGVPWLAIEHGGAEVLRIGEGSKLARQYARWAKLARTVFAVGPHMVEHLRAATGLTNVEWLPNGIVTDEEMSHDKPGAYTGTFVVLAAATYSTRKGFEDVVDAFAPFADRHADARLRVVTGAPPPLVARVPERLRGRVEFAGPLPADALRAAMAWADVFALPSRTEAFGLVYGEALGAGTPVVLADDAGFVPFAKDEWAWKVPAGDVGALTRAFESAYALRDTLRTRGLEGRAFVRRELSWEANARKLLAHVA